MRDAATSLIDLQVLGIASSEPKDHQIYGVIEPDKQKLDASQEGVGLLVTVKDAKGKDLAKLIIGKRVKGTEDQHFVRKPGQNPVYVVKIDPGQVPHRVRKVDRTRSVEDQYVRCRTGDAQRLLDYHDPDAGRSARQAR